MYPFSTLKNVTLVSVLYKLNLVTGNTTQSVTNYTHCTTIPSLILVSAGREEVRSHDTSLVSGLDSLRDTAGIDRVVLNVIPLSSLLNTHRNVSPGSVGGRLPGVNDMSTCSSRPGQPA